MALKLARGSLRRSSLQIPPSKGFCHLCPATEMVAPGTAPAATHVCAEDRAFARVLATCLEGPRA